MCLVSRVVRSGRRSLAIVLTPFLSAAVVLPSLVHAAGIEEIVITAQKREQNLQDVGIAVDTFEGEDLRALGATALADVTRFSTNVQLYDEYGGGQPTWVIRGVGLQDFNPNNTPTAAIYVDDVYLTSNVMGAQSLFDLERIEVLKGPQGALYGRNTSGGAVRVLSKRPDLEAVGGYVSGDYGRWESAAFEGAVNVPLTDSLAVRLAGRREKSGEGWQENVITGEEHGEQDRWALRGSLLAEFSDTAQALLRVHAAEDDSETALMTASGIYDPATFGFCAPLLEGRLDNSQCAAYGTFFDPLFRFPDVQDDDGTRTLSDPINQLDNSAFGASLELTFELGELTLTSITGYEDFEYGLLFDYDGGFGEYGHQHGQTDIETFSQEFRLASAVGERLDWQAGLEYATDDLTENRRYMYADDLFILTNPDVLGGEAVLLGYDQKTESYAAWGQIGYALTDALKLNAGVRYTDEEKDYEKGGITLVFDGFPFPLSSGLENDLQMDIFSGKVGLEWFVSDQAMLYTSVSRGFKSGGFFGGFPTNGAAAIHPYDEETVTAYEIGIKSQWLEDTLRFNAAAFLYDYEDAQGYTTVQEGELVLTRLGNVGDAEHTGVEFELLWLPTDRLTLQFNGAWLEAEITDSDQVATSWLTDQTGAPIVVPLEGLDRRMAPEWSYSTIGRYTMPVAADLQATFQVDYNWRDDMSGDGLTAFEDTLLDQQDAYGLLGARIALAPASAEWEVALWGRNLADEEYVTNVTTDDIASWSSMPGRPMSYGLSATWNW
jgi:iron complex outermembrane receptor protein